MNRGRGSGRLETVIRAGEPVVDMTAVLDAPLKDAVIDAGREQAFGVEGEGIGDDGKGLVMEDIANNSLDPTEVLGAPSIQEEVDDDVSSALMTPFSPILPQHTAINTGSKVGGDHGMLRGSPFVIQNNGAEGERDHSASVHTTSLLPYSLRSAKLLVNKPQLLGRSGSASGSTSPGGSLNGMQPKKKLSTTKTKPAFVNKLWSMVNDPANQTLIHWSESGKSFIVTQREQFVHEILPKYFKHSNFASFVRQLNMYGWHKVQDVKSGSIQNNSDDRWEFANDNFLRGREDLLTNILRQKPSGSHSKETTSGLSVNNTNLGAILVSNGEEVDLGILLTELETVKYNQMAIAEDLRRISKDNEMLWKENMLARERHQNQQQALEKIVKFLSSLYGSNTTRLLSDNLFHDHQQPAVSINNQSAAMAMSPIHMSDGIDNSILGGGDNTMMAISVPHRPQRPRLLLKQRSASSSSASGVAEWIKESPADELQSSTAQHPIIEEQIEPVHEIPSENALSTEDNHTSFFNDLHNNIERQGESIQEIQDWINRLSPNEHNDSPGDQRMPQFDPHEYLSAATPNVYNSPMGTLGQKRPLEDDAEEIHGASPSTLKSPSDTMTATEIDPHISNSNSNSNSNRNKKAKDFSGRL